MTNENNKTLWADASTRQQNPLLRQFNDLLPF